MRILRGMPVDGKRRFNPTFLLALNKHTPTSTPIGYSESLNLLKTNPMLGGLQIRYTWQEFETAFGVYNGSSWTEIQNHLDALNMPASEGGARKLSILLEAKRFDQLYDVVPAYMKDGVNGFYEDGQFDFPSLGSAVEGRNIKWQNVNVRARFDALMVEFGRRFGMEQRIELIGFPEAIPNATPTDYPGYNEDAHLAGILDGLVSIKNSMPFTIVRQLCNYNRPGMSIFIPNLVAAGISAFGGPDTYMDEPGLGINTPYLGIYQHMQLQGPITNNNVAIISEIQKNDFSHTTSQRYLKPNIAWGTITLTDNAGKLQLTGTGLHGMSVGNTVDTVDAAVGIEIKTSTGGFPASPLAILSVDSPNAMSVTNRAAWSSPVMPANTLNYATAMAAGLTSPAAGIRYISTGYPLGSGFTYDPRTDDATGFVPMIFEHFGWFLADIKPTHVLFTYNLDINTRTGISNLTASLNYLNSIKDKGKSANLWTTRALNIA